MIMKRIQTVLILAALVVASGSLVAQTRMEKAVLATSGGHVTTAGTSMDYTIGQDVTGMAQSATTMGQFGFWNVAAASVLAVDPEAGAGAVAALAVSPNPVADQASVKIVLARAGQVDVTLYDMTGKATRTLFSGQRPVGGFSLPLDVQGLASGTYFVAVSVPGALMQRPVTVVR
jgi:hypothetical protein